jgi:hypothetical protein
MLDADGGIVGGLAINEDVSADRARRSQLEHLHRLSQVGGGWYDADVAGTAGSGDQPAAGRPVCRRTALNRLIKAATGSRWAPTEMPGAQPPHVQPMIVRPDRPTR